MLEIGKINYNAGDNIGGAFQNGPSAMRKFASADPKTGLLDEVRIYAYVVSDITQEGKTLWEVATSRQTVDPFGHIIYEAGFAPGSSTRKRDALVAARQYIRNLDPELVQPYVRPNTKWVSL